jgi:UDP-N-acetylmuramoyl-tripeptide--D-alanyl-D-alanine ligase
MGMNHLGEIRVLTGMARPAVAVINNAGTAHIGEVGSRQNIAVAKGEIFEGLGDGGVRVLNADDAFCGYWTGLRPELPVLRFALDAPADVSARYEPVADGSRVWLRLPGGEVEAQLRVPGLHNVRNALAAAAVASALQVPVAAIARGLSGYRGTRGRLQPRDGLGGCKVVDDSYNANPDSTRAAIAWLAGLPGRRVLALGDMGELGTDGPALHAEVGVCARDAGLDAFHALGELSRHSVAAFGPGAVHHENAAALATALRDACRADTTILVKGSRFMRMERVVDALTGGASAGSDH